MKSYHMFLETGEVDLRAFDAGMIGQLVLDLEAEVKGGLRKDVERGSVVERCEIEGMVRIVQLHVVFSSRSANDVRSCPLASGRFKLERITIVGLENEPIALDRVIRRECYRIDVPEFIKTNMCAGQMEIGGGDHRHYLLGSGFFRSGELKASKVVSDPFHRLRQRFVQIQ